LFPSTRTNPPGTSFSTRKAASNDGKRRRETFEEGISVEAEFAFTQAVGNYCKAAVREGSFRGNYRFNLKEQMGQRAEGSESQGGKVTLLSIGGSQMGRITKEMIRRGGAVFEDGNWVEMKGRMEQSTVGQVLGEVGKIVTAPEKVLVGGPGNSLIRHGEKERKGFCPERAVKIEKGRDGEVKRVSVEYHMTEPVRISMQERRQLIERMVELVKGVQDRFPEAEVWYMTMFPRHVVRCCGKGGHMTEEDCWMVNGFRRSVDADLVEELLQMKVRVVEWWEVLGMKGEEGNVEGVRSMGVVCGDGVHLTAKANTSAAVYLCHRLAEVELMEDGNGSMKRAKIVGMKN
jgi:hypothetical protein